MTRESTPLTPMRKVALGLVLLAVLVLLWGFLLPPHPVVATSPDHDDPALRTRCYLASPDDVVRAAVTFVILEPDWIFVSHDPGNGTLEAVREAPPFRLRQDVVLLARPDIGPEEAPFPENVTSVDASSRSRFGKHDFGSNAGNLRALLASLDGALDACSARED